MNLRVSRCWPDREHAPISVGGVIATLAEAYATSSLVAVLSFSSGSRKAASNICDG